MLRISVLSSILLLAACKPPASDEYLARMEVSDERTRPSEPVDSPDTEGAAWALGQSGRLLYGKPGEEPLLSLACEDGTLAFTRYERADANSKAVLALIGNGHVERLWIDAEQEGEAWLWRGRLPADDPRLEVLTGRNRVEATVPGAGSLVLNASQRPGEFITRCAGTMAAPPEPEESPA
ncbi:hypothetical protein K3152_06560 [Qipengyuania sp. 1NDH17]|uniref:C-type lysozyme inhibitor domain-containing protein n=1 Tax=Qipengyuania polymorpha TaxID=2867234 RepID=A0ABS7IZK3_9SPHN|nr:hypothetical protein [Qipengyuania polymorpha]MBX7457902.1 hypothetical protein [Qipengyuania polymorpha]